MTITKAPNRNTAHDNLSWWLVLFFFFLVFFDFSNLENPETNSLENIPLTQPEGARELIGG